MNSNKIVALLPMKEHSERVPNKNFRKLCGKSLYEWILGSLLRVDGIHSVVINTDAECLLKNDMLKTNHRIVLRERKEELCGDFVSMNRIIEDDITAVSADYYLMTHATNPLLSDKTIQKAIDVILNVKSKYDSLFTVTKYQTRFYRENGEPINHDPDNLIRTQDLEPYFEENSNLYIFSRKSFQLRNNRIGRFPFMYQVPKLERIDIDDEDDWKIAEAMMSHLYKNNITQGEI